MLKSLSMLSWVLIFIVGLGIAYFAYDNLIVIPALPADHPDRGWLWLTSDPEVIEYIQTWFRNFGIWVLAVAVFVIVISVTGFRQGNAGPGTVCCTSRCISVSICLSGLGQFRCYPF